MAFQLHDLDALLPIYVYQEAGPSPVSAWTLRRRDISVGNEATIPKFPFCNLTTTLSYMIYNINIYYKEKH
jgi:hypothetical protein